MDRFFSERFFNINIHNLDIRIFVRNMQRRLLVIIIIKIKGDQ